ncbi:HNH endonuclease [Alistipes sp.]|uniref:HNH endonuclease n=1 Tax=Alistipes sp. TaxID=1872444 RepID=UPI003AF06914
MNNRIEIPYAIPEDEKQVIRDNFASHTDWDKSVFDRIKAHIIRHLRQQQENECCYCKRQLGFDIKEVDIEHIIPKSKYERFTFEPKNLALSCPGCNTKKGDRNVLRSKVTNYPRTGSNLTIIHAHYDLYSDHIEILNQVIYIPKTDKGCETIKLCELYRLKTVEDNMKAFLSQQDEIKKIVEQLRSTETKSGTLVRLLAQLRRILKRNPMQ